MAVKFFFNIPPGYRIPWGATVVIELQYLVKMGDGLVVYTPPTGQDKREAVYRSLSEPGICVRIYANPRNSPNQLSHSGKCTGANTLELTQTMFPQWEMIWKSRFPRYQLSRVT